MIQIFYSPDYALIKLKLKQLTKKLLAEQFTQLSFSENKWDQIKSTLTNRDLSGTKQELLILEDAVFLAPTKFKLDSTFDIQVFWKILEQLDSKLNLILTVNTAKLSPNWPKSISPIVHHIRPWDKNKLKLYVLKNLKPPLEEPAINYFLDICYPSSIAHVDHEIDKINHLYPPTKTVSLRELREQLVKPLSFDIFKISSSFLKGNLNEFLSLWHQGLRDEINVQQLLSLLGKQLVDLHWYFQYRKLGFPDTEIAGILGLNSYYLKKLLTINSQQVDQINDRIKKIYHLNKKILLGKIDKKIIPEYLFLKMFPNTCEREENGTN